MESLHVMGILEFLPVDVKRFLKEDYCEPVGTFGFHMALALNDEDSQVQKEENETYRQNAFLADIGLGLLRLLLEEEGEIERKRERGRERRREREREGGREKERVQLSRLEDGFCFGG